MTYRIEPITRSADVTLAFEGVLDRLALADLAARVAVAQRLRSRVEVRLRSGTEVETGALEQLVRLPGVAVTADAPFLSRWIASCQPTPGGGER